MIVEIDDELIEKLARAIHQRYYTKHAGAAPRTQAMSPWADLTDDVREANRAQARDISRKLLIVGCEIRPGGSPSSSFTADEVDRLARIEHERWCAQRTGAGWSYGPVRDDASKLHPSLVPWERLSVSEQDKDRDVVTNIESLIGEAGLHIARTR